MTCTCTDYQLEQVGCDCGDDEPVQAEAYFYDPATYAWTNRVVYNARNRVEAENWIKFNRSYAKYGKIIKRVEPVSEDHARAMRGDNS